MNYATRMTAAVAATATVLLIAPIERIVSSLYQPNRPTLTGTDIGNMAGAAYAQQVAMLKTPLEKNYRTVNDLLKDTRIKSTELSDYQRQIKNGTVMVFFYDNLGMDSASARLATVMAGLSDRFPDVKFVALESKKTTGDDPYLKLGYESTPDFMLYHKGNIIYRNPSVLNGKKGGGPSKGYEKAWVDALEVNLKQVFASNKVSSLN